MLHHTINEADCSIDIPNSFQTDSSINKLTQPLTNDQRCSSESSSLNSNIADICRICHCEGAIDSPLITPCYCSGSLRYVHQACLQQWIKSSNIRCCELCKFQFIMQSKVKPFNEWEYLEMSGLERKKLLCAMLFHIIAMTCVCWSLYVLINRTLDEVRKGHLEWPFWTKLIVVGIGLMGGIVFMYIQCKAYFILCKRWKAYNRVIYVQNAPEKSSSQSTKLLGSPSDKDHVVPSCSFKVQSDTFKKSIENLHETNCIDIKGVRNLHIFFGEENKIRVHRNERENNRITTTSENHQKYNENTNNGFKLNQNHVCANTSLHIQIGNIDCKRFNDLAYVNPSENSYGNAISPTDVTKYKQYVEQKFDKYQNPNKCKNDPVVKLQFKKAEIVIEFGENNNKKGITFLNQGTNNTLKQEHSWNGIRHINLPLRRYNSEEYLDCEKIANDNESPTSKLLVNRNGKVPLNVVKEKAAIKDWKSSEDLIEINKVISNFM